MKITDLIPNEKNPRKISKKKLSMLKKSINKFGDLSGIIRNIRTDRLISGHQRVKTIPQKSKIVKEIEYDTPTDYFTVAEGYVLINGERFKYREVDMDEKTEMEALLASNKHGGEWDESILKLNILSFPDLDFELSGFDLKEIESLGFSDQSDEEYLKENVGHDEFERKEIIGEGLYTNSGQNIDEPEISTELQIITITCKDLSSKNRLLEELKKMNIEKNYMATIHKIK